MPILTTSKKTKPTSETPSQMADDATVTRLRSQLAARKSERLVLVTQREQLLTKPTQRDDSRAILAGGLSTATTPQTSQLDEQIEKLDGAIAIGGRDLRQAEATATAAALAAAMPTYRKIVTHLFDSLQSAQTDLKKIGELEADLRGRGYDRASLPRPHGNSIVGDAVKTILRYLERLDFDELRQASQPGYQFPFAKQTASGSEARVVGQRS